MFHFPFDCIVDANVRYIMLGGISKSSKDSYCSAPVSFPEVVFKQGHLNLVTDYLLLIFYYSPIVTCSFLYFRNQIKRVHSLIFVAVDHIQRSK